MSAFLRAYRYVNILSLDTAVGAVLSSVFFAKLISAQVWVFGKLALGLTVWIIYTADHLLDARKVKTLASSERHRFHQQHFSALVVVMIMAVVIDAVLVLFMRRSLLLYGVSLSIVVGFYLVVSRYLKILKEIFIALIYTAGVMLPALADREHLMNQFDMLLMFIFFLVALINLLVFSWFDAERDRIDGHYSFVTFFGVERTPVIIYALSVISFATAIYLLVWQTYDVLALSIMMSMVAILIFILRKHELFSANDRFRYAGDAVFFLPGVYVLFDYLSR